MATSVSGMELVSFEFLLYAIIGFLLATALYVYASDAFKKGGFLAVIAFFIGMFYFLNYQWAPFSLAFGLLFLLFMIENDKKAEINYWDSFFQKKGNQETANFRENFLVPLERCKNIQILDAGCGIGTLTSLVAKSQQENSVVGIDSSKRSVRRASRELKTHANVEFIVGDLEHLPFKEGAFDVIIFSEVLEHILKENRKSVMQGLLHIISSRGKLFLTTPNGMYLPIFFMKIMHYISKGRLRSSITTHIYDHPLFPQSLIKLLKNAGWKVDLFKWAAYRTPFYKYNLRKNLPRIPLFAIHQLLIASPKK